MFYSFVRSFETFQECPDQTKISVLNYEEQEEKLNIKNQSWMNFVFGVANRSWNVSHSSGLESFLSAAGFSCSPPDLSDDPVGSSSSSE